MKEKQKKVIAILKYLNDEARSLDSYICLMSMQESTLNMMIKDLDIHIEEIIPQLDLTMELELLKTK